MARKSSNERAKTHASKVLRGLDDLGKVTGLTSAQIEALEKGISAEVAGTFAKLRTSMTPKPPKAKKEFRFPEEVPTTAETAAVPPLDS